MPEQKSANPLAPNSTPADQFATNAGREGESTPNESTPPQPSTPEACPRHIGRFEVVKLLGQGAFGAVYLAQDAMLARPVALKVPKADRFNQQETIEEFIAEARTVAQLNHPRIVKVHDVALQPDGTPIVVMGYVDGSSLKEMLEREKLSPRRCAELMADIADAVAEAHRQGLVHRDLKPANILLDKSGVPHVADFGLAVHESVQRRRKGEYAGTIPYMAPEQVRGEVHRLDGRADIWALGVMLYQMLSGRLPFGGNSLEELIDEIQHRDPKPPRQIDATLPVELERIIARCCAKDVTNRYSSAADLEVDLRAWLSSSTPGSSPSEQPTEVPAVGRRVLIGIVAALLAAALTAFVMWNPAITSRGPKAEDGTTALPLQPQKAPIETALPLSVQTLNIQHFEKTMAGDVDRGLLGRESFSAKLGDSVQIEAKLSKPAYAYLIAFRPDGTTELCFPESEDVAPPLTDTPRYPADNRLEAYELAEGVGLCVFAVIVSENPLPPYRAMQAELMTDVDWKPDVAPTASTVWWYDGRDDVAHLTRESAWGDTRAKGKRLTGPAATLKLLTDSLHSNQSALSAAAVGISVQ